MRAVPTLTVALLLAQFWPAAAQTRSADVQGQGGGAPACDGRLSAEYVGERRDILSVQSGLGGHTTGSARLDRLIIGAAARQGVDPVLLLVVMRRESAFAAQAVSLKGAVGLMQLTPATAARFGVRDLFNARQNVEAGARFLRRLLDNYCGNLDLTLAAYNAGEGAVRRYGRRVPPYGETRRYVLQVGGQYRAACGRRVG
jgi:soluble lytic murein transglycosylase-like protein